MDLFTAILLLLAATLAGSFLGTLVLRLPEGRPVLLDRSRCGSCGTPLGPLDLVPLLSWIGSGGRCGHCRARLSRFYPAIELAAVAVAGWCVAFLPPALWWPSAVLGWVLLALAEIDRRHFWLPDMLVLPLIPGGLLVNAWQGAERLTAAAIGAAACYLLLVGIAWIYRRASGRDGLGRGDAKLFAAAGAWVGWSGLPDILLIAALATLAAAILREPRAILTGRTAVPFGPGLALGFWLAWTFHA